MKIKVLFVKVMLLDGTLVNLKHPLLKKTIKIETFNDSI
jgi:hypothetical protein